MVPSPMRHVTSCGLMALTCCGNYSALVRQHTVCNSARQKVKDLIMCVKLFMSHNSSIKSCSSVGEEDKRRAGKASNSRRPSCNAICQHLLHSLVSSL